MLAGNRSQSGQALIVLVFAIMGLLGITALAVDGGNAYADLRRAQNAADTAALAGALARIRAADWVYASLASAAENGYTNDGTRSIVELHSPPESGPNAGDIEYIQVVITSNVPTYFAPIVGMMEITNVVQAVARTKTPEYKEMYNGAAVVSLAPNSDCLARPAFWVHGEATLSLKGGGVFVNSGNSTCALITAGNGSIRLQDGNISIVGRARIQKPQLITPYPPSIGEASVLYPPAFIMPKIGCQQEAVVSEDGTDMSPGWWDGDFPPEGVETLSNGVYCVNGDFILGDGQRLEGNGVVIKLEHGRLQFSNHAQFDLGAPHSGEYAGLLIYAPVENKSKIVLNGGPDANLVGTIFAPGAQIILNGSDNPSGWKTQIIGYTIEAKGNSNIVISYTDEQNYDALSMPELQFTK